MENVANTSSGPAEPVADVERLADGWPARPVDFGWAVSARMSSARLLVKTVALEAGLTMATIRTVRQGKHRPTEDTRRRVIRALAALAPVPVAAGSEQDGQAALSIAPAEGAPPDQAIPAAAFHGLPLPDVRHLPILVKQLQPWQRDWLLWALYSGGRHDELQRLQWTHLDVATRQIRIPGAKVETEARVVPMHPRLVRWCEQRHPGPRAVLQPWPLCNQDLGLACQRAEVPPVGLHSFRRLFFVWMLRRGVAAVTLARLMGHRDPRQESQVRGEQEAELDRQAISTLESLLVGDEDESEISPTAPVGSP